MFFREVSDSIGEGIELDNGYTSYKDGKIMLKGLSHQFLNDAALFFILQRNGSR